MHVILCVAGRGSRMRDVTSLPKCLVTVRERPLLEWALRFVSGGLWNGCFISSLAVVVPRGWSEAISWEVSRVLRGEGLGDLAHRARTVVQPEPLGSLNAVKRGLRYVDPYSLRPVMVLWGDALLAVGGRETGAKRMSVSRRPKSTGDTGFRWADLLSPELRRATWWPGT